MKFFAALRIADFALKFASAVGIDLNALMAKGTPEAAAAEYQAKFKPDADAVSALTAQVTTLTIENATLNTGLVDAAKENKEISAALNALQASFDAKSAELVAIREGLAEIGIKIPESTAEKPLDKATVAKTGGDRVSLKAREQLAKHGINDPLPVDPAADASAKPAPGRGLSGLAKAEAALAAKLNAAGPN